MRSIRYASARAVRSQRPKLDRPQSRFQSTQSSGMSNTLSHPVIGGFVGAAATGTLGYAWYHFSGAKAGVDSISTAQNYVNSLKSQLKQHKDSVSGSAPNSSQTIQWLRDVANSYAGLIPGGRRMVDSAFREIEELQKTNGEELEKVMKDAYGEMTQLTEKGEFDFATAQKGWTILMKYMDKIQDMAVEAGKGMLERHPGLDEKYGSKMRKLKQMGEQQGGDARKAAEEAFGKVQDVVKSGKIDQDAIGKAISEAFDKAQGISQDAWKQALDKAQPVLKQAPEFKEKLEQNADKLIHSDFKTLLGRMQEAASSGNLEPLKQEVDRQLHKAQGMGDEAWKGAKARASIYLDQYPEVKKMLDERGDVLKKIDFEELMDRIRMAKERGDMTPVKEYINRQLEKLKRQ